MRRAMLTSIRSSGGAPFTMGDTPLVRGGNEASSLVAVNEDNPAPRAGTVTSVSIFTPSTLPLGTTLTLFTASRSGTLLTIRAAVDVVTTVAGYVDTFATSLPVQAGDFIGIWCATNPPVRRDTSGGLSSSASSGVKPAPGGTYTVTTGARIYSIEGTGS